MYVHSHLVNSNRCSSRTSPDPYLYFQNQSRQANMKATGISGLLFVLLFVSSELDGTVAIQPSDGRMRDSISISQKRQVRPLTPSVTSVRFGGVHRVEMLCKGFCFIQFLPLFQTRFQFERFSRDLCDTARSLNCDRSFPKDHGEWPITLRARRTSAKEPN